MVISSIVPWWMIGTQRDAKNLEVFFLDVGQGDAALIVTPDNHRILIDTGKEDTANIELSKLIPYGENIIDAVFISHPQSDHAGDLKNILQYYRVDSIFITAPDDISTYNLGLQNDERYHQLWQSQWVEIDDLRVYVLWPNPKVKELESLDLNYESQILLVEYGDFRILFTGDAEVGDDALVEYGLNWPNIDVLKTPHHGSNNAITEEFISETTPDVAIISVGKNSYGHPAGDVLDILHSSGIPILRTDERGTIHIISDGHNWWL
ncbi:MBL fold metallo-hydrolase [candidate division WWE3 bacterium]|uniref:MBL fold metallo-hydrolase n=1 Tax=candidate division WWE3 bacterium TaxID=2053526 RepID=A0A955LG09_UNCKA|nr:MBL fold metallo-hydrolase [candidate division WWE3 bacterium]